jgi:hypothetical protein
MDRKTLIEQTIMTIREALMHLDEERDRIEYEIKDKNALLDIWQKELTALEKGKSTENRERAPKGEALRLIHELYDRDTRAQQSGLTIKQISEATKLNWSTARNVVKKPEHGFVEAEGRFRRAPEVDRQRRLKLAG